MFELLSVNGAVRGNCASVTQHAVFGSGKQLSLTEVEHGRLAHLPELEEWVSRATVARPTDRTG